MAQHQRLFTKHVRLGDVHFGGGGELRCLQPKSLRTYSYRFKKKNTKRKWHHYFSHLKFLFFVYTKLSNQFFAFVSVVANTTPTRQKNLRERSGSLLKGSFNLVLGLGNHKSNSYHNVPITGICVPSLLIKYKHICKCSPYHHQHHHQG